MCIFFDNLYYIDFSFKTFEKISTLTVRLKPSTTNGDNDIKTRVNCHPCIKAKITPPRTREIRAIKSGTLSLK